MLSKYQKLAKLAILRLGETATVSEVTEGALDGYNKPDPTAETVSPLGTETVVRVWNPGDVPSFMRLSDGRYPTDSPLLVLAPDTLAQEGFHVTVNGTTYEVDRLTPYPTHYEATTTRVNQ